MRHAWKYAAALGFVAATLSVGCTVTTDDDTSTGGTGGTTGGTGGTTGGTGGTTGGTGGTTGGTGGTGGSTGGSATSGTGGTSAGSGGSTAGTGGSDTTPSCDSDNTGTPYPNCDPVDPKDDCEVCIQKSCCAESKDCYATSPNNVCGWGGPDTEDAMLGTVTGIGEIGCYRSCLTKYVNDNGVCDTDGIDQCASACATPMCDGLAGTATSALAGCMQTNCSDECFGATACDAN